VDIVDIQIIRVIDGHIEIEVSGSHLVLRSVDGFLRFFSNFETIFILGSSCEVVEMSEFTERSNNIVRNSEPIDNTSTFEIEGISFFKDTSTDLRDILSCIRFT